MKKKTLYLFFNPIRFTVLKIFRPYSIYYFVLEIPLTKYAPLLFLTLSVHPKKCNYLKVISSFLKQSLTKLSSVIIKIKKVKIIKQSINVWKEIRICFI